MFVGMAKENNRTVMICHFERSRGISSRSDDQRCVDSQLEMTKKPRAIAYWLLPETAAREVFAEKICELARRFEAPVFAPHVSVFIAPENSRHPAEILPELGAIAIELTIHSIRFSEQFTKTLFVQFERSVPLQEMGDRIWKASGAPKRYVIDPHLSLLYASLAGEKKKALIDEIRFPFREVSFRSICAMGCARPTATVAEVEQWRLLAP
jgi:hypothetical protein